LVLPINELSHFNLLAQNEYDLLGTAAEDKFLIFFEDAAHMIFEDAPEEVGSEIINFIENYK